MGPKRISGSRTIWRSLVSVLLLSSFPTLSSAAKEKGFSHPVGSSLLEVVRTHESYLGKKIFLADKDSWLEIPLRGKNSKSVLVSLVHRKGYGFFSSIDGMFVILGRSQKLDNVCSGNSFVHRHSGKHDVDWFTARLKNLLPGNLFSQIHLEAIDNERILISKIGSFPHDFGALENALARMEVGKPRKHSLSRSLSLPTKVRAFWDAYHFSSLDKDCPKDLKTCSDRQGNPRHRTRTPRKVLLQLETLRNPRIETDSFEDDLSNKDDNEAISGGSF